ncbi:MAG: hypothetical protein ACRDTG_21250 [Pseudonocardiaceae bacterium]
MPHNDSSGGALADDVRWRRTVAVGGYSATAVLSALIGTTTSVVQAGVLRGLGGPRAAGPGP